MTATKQIDPRRSFIKTINEMSGRHELWRIFSDFCELAAISLDNAIPNDKKREERYAETLKRYEPEIQKMFPVLFSHLTNAMDAEQEQDFLGSLFMELELSSHWKGQFFTPVALCKVMASVTIGDEIERTIEKRGFFTASEPACGAGATIIGLCAALRDKGINYQQSMHVTATDVDATAAHMCFIQLSLLHVPAIVHVGNTLSMEIRDTFRTPAHHMGFWANKLRRGHAIDKFPEATVSAVSAPTTASCDIVLKNPGQMEFSFNEGAA